MMRTVLLLLLAAAAAFAQVRVTTARAGLRPSGQGKPARERGTLIEKDTVHVFPYIVDGATLSTELVFTGLEDHEVKVNCGFYGVDGKPVELTMPGGAGTGVDVTLAARATVTLPIRKEAAPTVTAWAYCTSDGFTDRFSGHAVVRAGTGAGVREFTIPMLADNEIKATLPVMAPATYQTGILVLNTADDQATVLRLTLRDATGTALAARIARLDAGVLGVFLVNTNFRDFLTAETDYSIQAEVVEGAPWNVTLALRVGGPAGTVAFTPYVLERWTPE